MATFKGIDVSKWQGAIDWNKVKAAGIDFAIIRAGYGKEISQKDAFFEANYKAAKAAGIPVGCYWYSYAKSVAEARKEAAVCMEAIKGKQFEYPVYFDIEDNSQVGLGKTTLTDICNAFCKELESAGYFVGVYANTNWFQNYLDHKALSAKYTIWLADYRTLYNITLKRDIHQYSSKGRVDGINGNVDMNKCTRDFPTTIKNAGLNGFQKVSVVLKDITIKQASPGDINDFAQLAKNKELEYVIS